MKRKLLTLCCTTVLCLSLISCGLKSAITGTNAADDTTDDSLTATENNDQTSEGDGDITNDQSTDANSESSTDSVLANNDFVDNSDSTSTTSSNNDSISSLVTTTDSSSSSTISRDCRIFYYNKVDSKTYCTDTKAPVTDNAFVTALTEKLYEAPNNNSNFITISELFSIEKLGTHISSPLLAVIACRLIGAQVISSVFQGFSTTVVCVYSVSGTVVPAFPVVVPVVVPWLVVVPGFVVVSPF